MSPEIGEGCGVRTPFDRAYAMLAEAEAIGHPQCGIATPFGVVEPEAWRWRVSPDVMQDLYNAMPAPFPHPNPKSGDDGTTRLFGISIGADRDLPPNAMLLERAQ